MTKEEAKQVFLSRGYVEVEGGTIYDAEKWRESCRVISEWLEHYSCFASNNDAQCFKDVIRSLPSVNPQPTGHWLHIDDVMSVFDDFMCGEVDEEGTDTFLEMLRDKAEQYPQEPKWISVSERLPEADGRYLCTYEDDIEENCVDFGSYENGEWYVDKVIAWMPLPKPYEPQESEVSE